MYVYTCIVGNFRQTLCLLQLFILGCITVLTLIIRIQDLLDSIVDGRESPPSQGERGTVVLFLVLLQASTLFPSETKGPVTRCNFSCN